MTEESGEHIKSDPAAPAGFFEVEAAGLRWLEEAHRRHGGVPVATVHDVGPGRIALARLSRSRPTPRDAEEFGHRLAATHRAGAPHHGCPPAGWHDDGFIGPLRMPHHVGPELLPWGRFYADLRVAPFARAATDSGTLSPRDAAAVDRVCERLTAGDLSGPEPAVARLHGDLWSGNVVWTPSGAVLIDPAAHGGHRETDLAMLALFGLPYLERVLAAYDEAWPLDDGWRERVPLHQLHPLLVHAVLFGGSYAVQAGAAARRCA